MTSAVRILQSHGALGSRRQVSIDTLGKVRREFFTVTENLPEGYGRSMAIFCAGSLAREELGNKSDLDLFFVAKESKEPYPPLVEYTLFGDVILKNRELKFQEFSNGGRFLKVQYADELVGKAGTPIDDSENLFTTRMLLILESKWIFGERRYEEYLNEVVKNYFRDSRGKKNFKPLFLLNDLLRYWRTLCLNYEQRRLDPMQPWRKKNVNLRFSRMITVFSTVLALISGPLQSAEDVMQLCSKTPLERLAFALDGIDEPKLNEEFGDVLDSYEQFLTWKEHDDIEGLLKTPGKKSEMREAADLVAGHIYKALNHHSIPSEYRRYLVI